jgi:hypothetical protein
LRKSVASAYQQLNQRQECSPVEFEAALDARERLFKNSGFNWKFFKPSSFSEEYSEEKSLKATSSLFPGSYYLRCIDAKKRRFYAKYEPAS